MYTALKNPGRGEWEEGSSGGKNRLGKRRVEQNTYLNRNLLSGVFVQVTPRVWRQKEHESGWISLYEEIGIN